ncbi:Hypothetical predicted protein, partial [Olea europaea subsp. europaea]
MFVFGSSLVDNGNSKVDYLPYGIDFPFGPSGRFTNGKNVIDLLGEHWGIPTYIPPFTDPSTKGKKIVYGVTFASEGSGILDDSGAIAKFEAVTLPDLEMQLRSKSRESLPKFLFVVGSRGNSLHYFMGLVNSNVSLEEFTAKLTTTLIHQLERLYNLGARKFALMSINPNGCTPMARARFSGSRWLCCAQSLNRAVHIFNVHLKTSCFCQYKVIRDIIRDPAFKGFNTTRTSCCEVAAINEGGAGILCKRGGSICTNRSNHAFFFFNGLHPTEAVNLVIANVAYASNFNAEVHPMNLKQLSEI